MRERAVAFGPNRRLIGIWTEPDAAVLVQGAPTLIMINSGIVHHAGIHRLHVRLGRAVAESGFRALRFDLAGIGDSGVGDWEGTLEELVAENLRTAIDFAETKSGVKGVVLAGLCSGARDGLDHARRDPSVVGVVMIDLIADLRTWQHEAVALRRRARNATTLAGISRHFRNRGSKRAAEQVGLGGSQPFESLEQDAASTVTGIRSELSREALARAITELRQRDVALLFSFSDGLAYNYNHEGQLAQAVPAARGDRVACSFFQNTDHTFSDRKRQSALISTIEGWMRREFSNPRDG